jgi:hypothetical protein
MTPQEYARYRSRYVRVTLMLLGLVLLGIALGAVASL